MTSPWHDDAQRYGRVTRLLHWTMAAIIAWQFAGMIVKLVVGRSPLTAFWVGSHSSVGMVLMLLILIRMGWALAQRRHRPSHVGEPLGRFAVLGHRLLYALLLVVPALALARHLGAGRDLAPFGLTLVRGSGNEIDWLMAPANALHSPLAWLLLALILGHIAMVGIHHWIWRDGVARRMIGRSAG